MTLGQRIKKARIDAGYKTYRQCEEATGLSATSIHKWESGNYKPGCDALRVLAKVLGVSADWLLGIEKKGGR